MTEVTVSEWSDYWQFKFLLMPFYFCLVGDFFFPHRVAYTSLLIRKKFVSFGVFFFLSYSYLFSSSRLILELFLTTSKLPPTLTHTHKNNVFVVILIGIFWYIIGTKYMFVK